MPNTSLQNPPGSAPAATLPPVSVVTLRFKDLPETGIDIGDQPHRRVKVRISDTITSGGKRLAVSVIETTSGDLAWRRYEHGSESEILTIPKAPATGLVLKIEATEAAAPNTAAPSKRKSSLTIPPTTEVDGEDPV